MRKIEEIILVADLVDHLPQRPSGIVVRSGKEDVPSRQDHLPPVHNEARLHHPDPDAAKVHLTALLCSPYTLLLFFISFFLPGNIDSGQIHDHSPAFYKEKSFTTSKLL